MSIPTALQDVQGSARAAAAGSGAIILVSNSGENTVALVSPETYRVVGTVPVGRDPHEITLSRDRKRAFVATTGGGPNAPAGSRVNAVTAIELDGDPKARSLDLGRFEQPHDVRVSSDGSILWVACAPARTILEIDSATGRLRREWKTGADGGWFLAVTADDRRIYVPHLEGKQVTVIDRDRQTVSTALKGGAQSGLDAAPDGGSVWVIDHGQARINILEANTGAVRATVPLPSSEFGRLRFTRDGRRVVLVQERTMTIFDAGTRKPLGTIALPYAGKVVDVSPAGDRAVVSHPEDDRISIVDLAARKLLASAPVGKRPDGVAWVGDPLPADSGASRQRVSLASDGWTLAGDYVRPSGTAVAAVLLLHGAARDRRAYIALAGELEQRGLASLRLDLRGEGESTNLGRFEPGRSNALLEGSERDVAAALAWLRRQPGIDPARIGVLGASYSAEAMAAAGRAGARGAAYVALSPGDFSDESIAALDAAAEPWWFIASTDERFAHTVVETVRAKSRTARVTFVAGTSHASDILSPHFVLNAEIADWFAARLRGAAPPRLWGGLDAGAFDVGFRRDEAAGRVVDVWYPAAARGAAAALTLGDYLALSDDLRGAVGRPDDAGRRRATLATAVTGDPTALPDALADDLLGAPLLARRDAPPAPGRFPLLVWTPRYATTVAQAVLTEYLASHGFVVAFARPRSGAALPFELTTPAAKLAELQARVEDMRAALGHLEGRAHVDARAIGVLAWSFTGEMATAFQLQEPRVTLVAGLSTTVLGDWVYRDPAAIGELDPEKLTAAYVVMTQPRNQPAPPLLDRLRTGYYIEFPHLAHGSFNFLEGFLPSLVGIRQVQRWSRAGPEGIAGYEAIGRILLRLARHHVTQGRLPRMAPLPLTSGLPAGVAAVDRR